LGTAYFDELFFFTWQADGGAEVALLRPFSKVSSIPFSLVLRLSIEGLSGWLVRSFVPSTLELDKCIGEWKYSLYAMCF
jgi:hypothetical protein